MPAASPLLLAGSSSQEATGGRPGASCCGWPQCLSQRANSSAALVCKAGDGRDGKLQKEPRLLALPYSASSPREWLSPAVLHIHELAHLPRAHDSSAHNVHHAAGRVTRGRLRGRSSWCRAGQSVPRLETRGPRAGRAWRAVRACRWGSAAAGTRSPGPQSKPACRPCGRRRLQPGQGAVHSTVQMKGRMRCANQGLPAMRVCAMHVHIEPTADGTTMLGTLQMHRCAGQTPGCPPVRPPLPSSSRSSNNRHVCHDGCSRVVKSWVCSNSSRAARLSSTFPAAQVVVAGHTKPNPTWWITAATVTPPWATSCSAATSAFEDDESRPLVGSSGPHRNEGLEGNCAGESG